MRFKITFKTEKLPILYRHRFMALIKEALERVDKTYKQCLYPQKEAELSKIAKPFCFSLSMPKDRIWKKEKIVIDEGIEIEETVFYFPSNQMPFFYISSSEYEFMINLYNGLLSIKEFSLFDGVNIKLDRIFMMNEKKINSDHVVFKTDSPVLTEDKSGKPLLPFESPAFFNDNFNAIHDRILKDIRGNGIYREMQFEPVDTKKQVVKHTLKGFREKTGKPYMTLTCFEGCFKLKGDPRDLQMLYQTGIGLRTGQGFGMVEVV